MSVPWLSWRIPVCDFTSGKLITKLLVFSLQYTQSPLTDLVRVTDELMTVVLDANETEDQSTENLAAISNTLQRIVNDDSLVLNDEVSPLRVS